MPAVTIDVSVASSQENPVDSVVAGGVGVVINTSLPTSNPILPINTPVVIGSENISAINSPINISSITSGAIGAPVNITSESIASINTPVNIGSESISAIALPVNIGAESISDIALPINIGSESISAIALPVNISSENITPINTPVAITANALDPEVPPFALNHARVLYDSVLNGSSSFTDNGVNPSFPLIPNTAQRWTTSVNSFIKFIIPINSNVDTVCIGAHNLNAGNYTVSVFYRTTDLGTLTSFASSVIPSNNNAIMIHRSSAVSAKVIEIYITSGSGAAFIGSIYAGIALQMQRPFFVGHTPAVLARQADYYSSNTESGNFIGVEVRRRAIESQASWANLSDAWYRSYFVPFLESAELLPFYFAWNLLQHPTDVAYCKNITNVAPSYSGTLDKLTVDIPLIGIA
jgi:hypothetical protein